MDYDVIIVGAGIVGAATAWQLQRTRPGLRIALLDKEASPAQHQSGHNSGVIHAGVYYPPGSLKARLCREGASATKAFCRERGIAVDNCGKLIVATTALEQQRLRALQQRCQHNALAVKYLGAAALREREPRVSGLAALWVAETAVVDFRRVCAALIEEFQARGGELLLGAEVQQLQERAAEVVVETAAASLRARQLVTCAGLMADRLVAMMGLPCEVRILPFRGEFYRLNARCDNWFSHLIYPVPDPAMPFLGVHLTRTVNGGVIAGPNAVLALAREGYRRADIDFREVGSMLRFPGFWRLLSRHWQAGVAELANSFSRRHYLQLLQRYCPELQLGDLSPAPSGVRAQAVTPTGELVQDFRFVRSARSLHVVNAPSPAATSALPIGAHIAAQLAVQS